VLLFNLTYVGPSGYPGIPPAPFTWRHPFGTAVLLIASGYFAATTLREQPARQWLKRRLAQLLPAYLLVVVAVFALMRLFAPDDLDLGHRTYWDLLGNLLLVQQLVPSVNFIDGSSWILPIQVLAFVTMAVATRRLGPRGRTITLWSLVIIPLAVDQLWMRHGPPEWLVIAIDGTGLRYAHLLVIGIAICRWSTRRMATTHFACLVVAALIANRLESPKSSFLLIVLMTGIMCLAARGPDWNVAGLRRITRPISWLAGCSYGIYLVHQSIGYLVEERLAMVGVNAWLWVSAPFVVAVFLGWALTVGVQRPALRLLDSDSATPWRKLEAEHTISIDHTPAVSGVAAATATQRVYLHIGLAKTGTTHLQQRLWVNREAMAGAGLLYPGATAEDHFRAACLAQPQRYPHWIDSRVQDVWQRLIDQIREWPATSVLSHELFGSATAEQAREVLAALSFAEVHLVCTVRDLARQVPSVWQENLKNGYTVEFPDFVNEIAHCDPDDPRDLFWEFQDAPRILRTWAEHIPPDRVHVICVPPQGSDENLLWHRFLGTLGISVPEALMPVTRHNSSLDAAQSALLLQVNRRLRTDLPWAQYEAAVKSELVEGHLRHTRPTRPLTLPDSARPWVTEHTERCIGEISARGYHVVGDLDELRPREQAGLFGRDVEESEILDVALDALVHIIEAAPPQPDFPASRMIRIRRWIRARIPTIRRGSGAR
jgi:peptidoglycan/LPS O-acetylase OafA/YrhL